MSKAAGKIKVLADSGDTITISAGTTTSVEGFKMAPRVL